MFKPFILVLINCLLFSSLINADESLSETITQLDQTTVSSTTTTTPLPTTTTTTTKITTTLNDLNKTNLLYDSKSLSPMVKEKTVANFAQYNGKLLVNQTAESSMNGRIIAGSHNSNNGVTAVSTNGLSMTIVIAIIAVVTIVVSAIIISAVFVMKRRFSIWRLNGDGSSDSKAGTSDDTKESSDVKQSSEAKCLEVNEKDPEVAKQVAMAADQPVSVNVENAQSTETTSELKSDEQQQQQASPSSSSPLIEKTNEEIESTQPVSGVITSEPVVELNKEQVTSSSSLIVNVLNELSESVACKLANAAHSPAAKSSHSNTVESNTETQPLNNDE